MEVSIQERRHYSDAFKHEIIQKVLSGGITKEEARRKYGIKGKSAILRWMRKFGYPLIQPEIKIITTPVMDNQEQLPDDPALLKQRIKQLEKELELARLSAQAQSSMIDIAEQTFKIPIRKSLLPNNHPNERYKRCTSVSALPIVWNKQTGILSAGERSINQGC